MPTQVWPLLHTTEYTAAPLSSRGTSVNMVSPDRSFSVSAFASASSTCSSSASRVSGSSNRIVLSVLPAQARAFVSLRPTAVGAPTIPASVPLWQAQQPQPNPPQPILASAGEGWGAALSFSSFLCSSRPLDFFSLVRITSSWDRPGRRAKGSLQRAATART